MALETPQQLGQSLGVTALIIEPAQQDVFKADPAAGQGHVFTTILEQILNGIGTGRWNQLLPQCLVGGMEAERQGELGATQAIEGPFGKTRQAGGDSHRAHGDLPLGHAQFTAEAIDRRQHGVNVEQGLTHAHEHHVGGPALHHFAHTQHLVDDFVELQRALQALLTRGTEAAGHRAAHLAADTHR